MTIFISACNYSDTSSTVDVLTNQDLNPYSKGLYLFLKSVCNETPVNIKDLYGKFKGACIEPLKAVDELYALEYLYQSPKNDVYVLFDKPYTTLNITKVGLDDVFKAGMKLANYKLTICTIVNLSQGKLKVEHKLPSLPKDYTSALNSKFKPDPSRNYKSKKGHILKNHTLQRFETFWKLFCYKNGKADAADIWYVFEHNQTIHADNYKRILSAATQEAKQRPAMEAAGHTPKMAQGWLSSRRWEDGCYDLSKTYATKKAQPNTQKIAAVKKKMGI